MNVCIYRIPADKSIIYPPSSCPKCHNFIKGYDNIPILSYILLKGKCRSCSTKISIIYPIVEFITGLLFVIFFLKFGLEKIYFFYIMMIGYMIILSFIDINGKIVPDVIILFLIITGMFFGVFGVMPGINIFDGIIGAVAGGTILHTLCFFSNGKISDGDTALIAAIGLCTGFKEILGIINYAFIIGGAYALITLLLKVHKRKDAVAFVPFIAAAFILRALLF